MPWPCASCCWQCAVPVCCRGSACGCAWQAQDTHARGTRAFAATLFAAPSAACAGDGRQHARRVGWVNLPAPASCIYRAPDLLGARIARGNEWAGRATQESRQRKGDAVENASGRALLAVHRRALHHVHPRVRRAADRPVPAVLAPASPGKAQPPRAQAARDRAAGSRAHVYPVEHAPRVEVLIVLPDGCVSLQRPTCQSPQAKACAVSRSLTHGGRPRCRQMERTQQPHLQSRLGQAFADQVADVAKQKEKSPAVRSARTQRRLSHRPGNSSCSGTCCLVAQQPNTARDSCCAAQHGSTLVHGRYLAIVARAMKKGGCSAPWLMVPAAARQPA